MRLLLAVALLFVEALAFGQGFNRRYDLFGNDFAQGAWDIEKVSTGYCILGSSSDYDSIAPGESFFHASVVHTFVDANGLLVDERRSWRPLHSAFPGWANCCDTVPGGGFVVGGSSEDTLGNDEVYLMRFNAQGDTLWTRVFGDPALNDYWIGRQVKHTSDGGFLIVGDTDASGGGDGFVLRTDSSGNELWRETYSEGGLIDGIVSIERAANGDHFTGGVHFVSMTNSDFWVQRIDSVGAVRWSQTWGGGYKESNAQLAEVSDGNTVVAGGWSYDANFALVKPYLAKLDSTDGSIIWQQEYGPETYSTSFFAAKERPNGDLIACGVCYYGGDQQGLLLRTTSEGDSLWMRSYFYQDTLMQDGTGRFYDVLPTEDGGFIAAGAAYHSATIGYPAGYSQDTWVVKVDSMGCIVPGCDATGITEIITNLGSALTLYPVPLRRSQGDDLLHVGIHLPQSFKTDGVLTLSVISLEGKLLHQQQVPTSAPDEITLTVGDLAAGTYTVHLSDAHTWIAGKKFVVE
jgi:outer membrane protein assembly factor BamB